MRAPETQADGLRRLFAGPRLQLLAVAANPHVAFGGLVLDRIAAALAAQGRRVLVVDAGAQAPAAPELARLDLAACIEPIARGVDYLPARGLPLAFVDARGGAGAFLTALHDAAPQADALLLHADAGDLARVLRHRAARPLLLAADRPDSLKHAYADAKLLAQRCTLATFDLAVAASARSPRLGAIVDSLSDCLDRFLGAVLCHAAVVDPAAPPAQVEASLAALLAAQGALDDDIDDAPTGRWPAAVGAVPAAASAALRPVF